MKPADFDDTALLAIAKKVDDVHKSYNEVSSVYDRMVPKDKKPKKQKV